MPQKPDWPALKPDGGIVHVTRDMLIALAVKPFENKNRREELAAKLFCWMNEISVFGFAVTVWVDGSFATTKEAPADIDICVLLTDKDLRSLDNGQYARVTQLLDRSYAKTRYDLDLYVVDAKDVLEQGSWQELFGKGHDRITVKGIFALKAQE